LTYYVIYVYVQDGRALVSYRTQGRIDLQWHTSVVCFDMNIR